MNTNVLVTGANGQLAKTIQQLYGQKQVNIIFTYVSKEELDITNKGQVTFFFKKKDFDYCINCAAYTNVEQAEKMPELALNVNASGVKNLAETCHKSNTVLIHISTDYVFDGKKDEPYTEEDIPNPINTYGKSKLRGEQYVQDVLDKYFIIRTSWLYSNYGHNFLKTIIKKIKEKKELKITTAQTGTPTSCIELSKFIFFLIKSRQNNFGTYHFSALGGATWYDFAEQITKHYQYKCIQPIFKTDDAVSKVNRPKYSVLDNQKAKFLMGTIKTWEQALKEEIQAI